ncbi:MAG: hypothetical protein CVU41_10910 [Chloroflexi bacterium HGW-Chloroflexi-3]|nr:MAG: hypothetical protein CVU41_10910 [Chloroflexi bacterium HGW-Chloroflexi-3]
MNIRIKENSLFLNKNLLIIIFGIIVQIIYLGFSYKFFSIGFPLDDSWIHQTYARNLVEYGGWFFIPGILSAGSTSPLWTLLLIPGHLFQTDFFYYWTFFISGIFFIGSSIVFQKLFEKLIGKSTKYPWAGFLFLFEWHLVWSASSGMETILFIFILMSFLYLLLSKVNKNLWLLLWVLLGIVIFVRPDGLTLLGPYILINVVNFSKKNNYSRKNFVFGLLVVSIFLIFYALFNMRLSGEILPNTFFAKQAEYQILYSKPLLSRYLDMFLVSLTGSGILLLPGFLYYFYHSIKKRNWEVLSVYFWFFGYLLIYAVRLPATYQHGRYVIPAIPVYLLLSLIGIYSFCKHSMPNRILIKFGYKVSILAILLIFFILGGKAYAEDVAIIQSEMVDTSMWINKNLPPDAVIAAHDIGAMGFFAGRQIIDLAGLISPEVIPFIRNEDQLSKYLDEKHADYLVIFPGWYDKLDQSKKVIYRTNGTYSPKAGGENMTIFIWD